jgi:hypothetical protein
MKIQSEFCVKDNGSGIPEEVGARYLNHFTNLKLRITLYNQVLVLVYMFLKNWHWPMRANLPIPVK